MMHRNVNKFRFSKTPQIIPLLPNIPKVNKMLYKKKDENLQEKKKIEKFYREKVHWKVLKNGAALLHFLLP